MFVVNAVHVVRNDRSIHKGPSLFPPSFPPSLLFLSARGFQSDRQSYIHGIDGKEVVGVVLVDAEPAQGNDHKRRHQREHLERAGGEQHVVLLLGKHKGVGLAEAGRQRRNADAKEHACGGKGWVLEVVCEFKTLMFVSNLTLI